MSQSQPDILISPKEAKKRLWEKGLTYWKLDSNQQGMRDFINASQKKISVLVCSRQLGKTYALCCIAIEECLQKPNRKVMIIAPEVKMIKNILYPRMREILQDCPDDLLPKYKTNDHKYEFPNGSEIQLAGTDSGNAESIRGTTAHLCIVDEAGFCSDLNYIIKSILIPTTTTTRGKIILSSTPPKTNDHEFKKFWEKSELDSTLFKRTIYDNPRLTEKDIEDLAESVGGKDSDDWRREYLCEAIISDQDAVVPEFTKDLQEKIIKEWPRPAYYDAYASMDIGVRDLTVVLFAYYDFKNGKIVIEDEIVLSGHQMVTDVLAETIKSKEKALWVHNLTKESKEPYLRVADNNNLILLNDLHIKHKLHFMPIQKDNSDAALNNMRLMLKQQKIIINPRCKTLIYHLQNAIWNKNRTSYLRSQDNGHFDAIDSIKYLCRGMQLNRNPYPHHYQFEKTEDLFFSKDHSPSDPLHDSIKKMFQAPRKRRFNK